MNKRAVSAALRICVVAFEETMESLTKRFPRLGHVTALRVRIRERVLHYKALIGTSEGSMYETRRSRRLLDAARRDAQAEAERDRR